MKIATQEMHPLEQAAAKVQNQTLGNLGKSKSKPSYETKIENTVNPAFGKSNVSVIVRNPCYSSS